ncbi:MAG: PDC sensor domain-containing protein [Thiobacillaceae bacterium]
MTWMQSAIRERRAMLAARLHSQLEQIAQALETHLDDPDALDAILIEALPGLSPCDLFYVVDRHGRQISSNISTAGRDVSRRSQDLSVRPYLRAASAANLLLSPVYVSRITELPCITAVQCIQDGPRTLGFLAADFSLGNLSLSGEAAVQPPIWMQIKGDPAIRQGLFSQCRVESALDQNIDDVISIVEELMHERGIFHAKLHFSSSRATLWLTSDPMRYRVHVLDEILSPEVCLAYPNAPYPDEACIPPGRIRAVLRRLKELRQVDENIYLRAGSLNVVNGLVGLNFSCDGSHYLPAEEFLSRDARFWF